MSAAHGASPAETGDTGCQLHCRSVTEEPALYARPTRVPGGEIVRPRLGA
jgi:hypothetical protein